MRFLKTATLLVTILGCAAHPPSAPQDSGFWEIVPSMTDASLRGLFVVNDRVAWASGSAGTYLRSTDGGLTWTVGIVRGAEALDFRDVHAWSEDDAILLSAGSPAKIVRTEDGGATWTEEYANEREGVFFNSMDFWNTDRGIAVADPMDGRFMLIRTDDGGKTWTELPFESRPEALPSEANFAASGTCIATGQEGVAWFGTGGPAARILRTTDWGASWSVNISPLRSGEASQGVFGLLILDHAHGLAVGGDYLDEPNSAGNAARTEDGGVTWTLIEPGPSGFRECVVPKGAHTEHLIAVGPSGSDITFDGGKNWQPIPTHGRLHAVAFSANGRLGLSVGAEGLVEVWRDDS